MRTVVLRAKQSTGPVTFFHRPSPYRPKIEFRFDFENAFTNEVPADLWESLQEKFLDARTGLKYKDAFKEM